MMNACKTAELFSFFYTPTQRGLTTVFEVVVKCFAKASFQLRMELKKEQKKRSDERMQADYPTPAKYTVDVG